MGNKKTTLKEFRLDVEGLMFRVIHGHGYLHYGYFPEKTSDGSIISLGRAQQHYFDKIAGAIPSSTKRILDVGSGTGSNAESLTKLGYHVDCLCPSEKLNDMARQKLPETSTVWDTCFEDFSHKETYDTILCAESFHYIRPAEALKQMAKYSNESVIIFDYFLHDREKEDNRKLSHEGFKELVEKDGTFEIDIDEDCTEHIMPTFQILDSVKNDNISPFMEKTWETFKKEHPFRAFWISLFFKKKIEKAIHKKSNRSETFSKKYSYRFIKMNKKAN